MCGIMGIWERKASVDIPVLQQMQKVLRHRGPDDSGLEVFSLADAHAGVSSQLGVAFDRLSIRDLTATGHQPMWDKDRVACIAMNGEIYNADELRKELPGVSFRGTSDTEVFLYLYLNSRPCFS